MADLFGNNTTRLAVVNSRVSAGMGLGYAIASLVGGERGGAPCRLPAMISFLQTPSSAAGPLAARDIRYAYAASCAGWARYASRPVASSNVVMKMYS